MLANAHMLTCSQCQKLKIKCHFEVLVVMMDRLVSREKHKESEALATMIMTFP